MKVAAIVLAAGTSSRYGANKLLLPFGDGTVISTVLAAVNASAARPVLVITGYQREQIEAALAGQPAKLIHNPDFEAGEMLSSIKCGINALRHSDGAGPDGASPEAALIVLGDQPLVQPDLIDRLITAFAQGCGQIIAPRYQLDGPRGHPVLIARQWWDSVLALPPGSNVRDLLKAHPEALAHLVVNTTAILRDVDTPEAYEAVDREFRRQESGDRIQKQAD